MYYNMITNRIMKSENIGCRKSPFSVNTCLFSLSLHVETKHTTMTIQTEITLKARQRGFHLITDEIMAQLPGLPAAGLLNLFIKHTSCGLCINENADPDVRYDMEGIFNRMVPEGEPYYSHTLEGRDDMPAHAKSVISGVSLNIPITNGRLNLGTWQGIYLCEYRNHGGARRIVATIIG